MCFGLEPIASRPTATVATPTPTEAPARLLPGRPCTVCMYIYIYIYIYTHMYTYRRRSWYIIFGATVYYILYTNTIILPDTP